MKPVILDVDTGLDDACALLLAARHPELDLKAVTCVGGNVGIDDVVANTLTVLEAAGRADVPVARGAGLPLLQPMKAAPHVHGADGLGDLDWPRSTRTPVPGHAIELLRDVLRAAAASGELVTLIPLAPMTNIALLLRTYPDAAAGLREIVFMGGAAGIGNATASAEFNIWTDPEAAAITLTAAAELGIPVTMYGLDVFYDVVVSRERAQALSGSPAAELARKLIEKRSELYGDAGASIGDGGAVCAVIDPAGMTTQRFPLRVELAGSWSRGRTIVDTRDWTSDLNNDPHGQSTSIVDVVTTVDGGRYAELWLAAVEGA
ncbi:nucleoside hydrolase [Kribbella sandramycini]|uniref:Nucleoside hydrolase n=1 Tax=Kribbella sandramycini TaxID=60450 RepID=A0A7Y4L3I2_9ACTN|nr:nucleoside hydrolase [Kribbella sandramycini]MBB6570503.1 pyrimidine-specific ribonucleoside hydrolase [Kribbella sandramycini]NOL43649.1 nucleoside hydrolase [Kribbella sandramycini]